MIKRYKVIYSVNGSGANIRYIKAFCLGDALKLFAAQFPEAVIDEMIEV